jgi:TolB protein
MSPSSPLSTPFAATFRAGGVLALLLLILAPEALLAQWTNRYPRVEGYGHHVYLEGYELPTLSAGVMDPAPGPDGRHLAFTSRGWIWVLDLETSTARRLTDGEHMDFRPAWSPEGDRIAFVRDTGRDTYVVVVDAVGGQELHRVGSDAIDLDPAFTPDGEHLLYSSAREGTLDLWRIHLASGREERLTTEGGIQLRPQPHPDPDRLVYLSKAGGRDQVRYRRLSTGEERVLLETSIASQARPALAPDGRTVAVNWPVAEGWELRLMDVETPQLPVFLTRGDGLPLAPAWSPDGAWIYFSHATPHGTMELHRIPAVGGEAEAVPVRAWDWGEPTGVLRIRTTVAGAADPQAVPAPAGLDAAPASRTSVPGGGSPAPVRLNVLDGRGHPALPDRGQPRFDGQNGKVFFYSPGVVEVELPAGSASVTAVQGLATPAARRTVEVRPGGVTEVELTLELLWDARAQGWMSGEHHFHLNYGGPFQLQPSDVKLQMAGEAMEVATPLLANLHNRFGEREFWGWSSLGRPPHIVFGQEVRSHFLGHVGLVGIHDLFWPWIWGPGYQVHGRDDRTNAEALRFARAQGGVGSYVHPVMGPDPFADGNLGMIPVSFVPDAVLGDLDALEMVCLWSSELGTSELWYRVLNLGIPVAATAGTDVMTDFYRTMAIGTARVFVRTGDDESWSGYLDGLREGRSFVTTGPYLDFQVGGRAGAGAGAGAAPAARGVASASRGVGPGEVVAPGTVQWTLDLRSAGPVEEVEILVNGQVVHRETGLTAAGAREYRGTLDLPDGGWIAARAYGGGVEWPAMGTYPFAHSGAIWIGERGSVDPEAASRAARELLAALDVAEARLHAGYEGVEIPRLQARFDEARARLEEWVR